MSDSKFEITAEKAFDRNDREAVLLKLSTSMVEVNIYLDLIAVDKLRLFHKGKDIYCLAGESAASPVHWKKEDSDVYILIGDDQEVWDIGITVDNDVLDQVLVEIDMALS